MCGRLNTIISVSCNGFNNLIRWSLGAAIINQYMPFAGTLIYNTLPTGSVARSCCCQVVIFILCKTVLKQAVLKHYLCWNEFSKKKWQVFFESFSASLQNAYFALTCACCVILYNQTSFADVIAWILNQPRTQGVFSRTLGWRHLKKALGTKGNVNIHMHSIHLSTRYTLNIL